MGFEVWEMVELAIDFPPFHHIMHTGKPLGNPTSYGLPFKEITIRQPKSTLTLFSDNNLMTVSAECAIGGLLSKHLAKFL